MIARADENLINLRPETAALHRKCARHAYGIPVAQVQRLVRHIRSVSLPEIPVHFFSSHTGDVVHVDVLGQPIVIVGSAQAANDLFEKRSALYSGRAHSAMVIEYMGWGWSFGMMNYGERWKKHRKVFHQFFNQNAVDKYRPVQTREGRMLLRRLLKNPDGFLQHIRL